MLTAGVQCKGRAVADPLRRVFRRSMAGSGSTKFVLVALVTWYDPRALSLTRTFYQDQGLMAESLFGYSRID